MRRLVGPARAALAERLPVLVDDALQHSLANPGEPWQRAAHRLFGVLAGVLPIAAMLWIGWRAFEGFRRGGTNPAAYLGSDFAVNGALLLALAWLLPLFLQRRLRPSRERAAARGLRAGLARALEEVRHAIGEALGTIGQERDAIERAYATIWRAPAASSGEQALPERVRRMLFDEPPRAAPPSAGVRASAQSSTATAPVS